MTTKEMVINVLQEHSCLTSFEIKGFVYRMYGEKISTQSAAGILRPFVSNGLASKSPHPSNGKMVYWLTDLGKKVLK